MKTLLLTISIVAMSISLFAQTVNLTFSKKAGGDNNDYFYSNCFAFDKVWSAGMTQSGDLYAPLAKITNQDGFIYGCTTEGDSVYAKIIGGTGTDYARDIIQGGSNNLIVVGITRSSDGDFTGVDSYGSSDGFLMVIDTLGALMYVKKYGGSEADYIHKIIRTSNDGFLLIGESQSNDGSLPNNGSPDTDAWAYRLAPNLDSVWSVKLGYLNYQAFYDAVGTSDGGCIFAGCMEPVKKSDEANFWVVKLNSVGDYSWEIIQGGSAYERPLGIYECNDGNFMAYGFSNSNDGGIHDHIGGADGYVIKFTPEGDTLWTKSLGWSGSDESISDVFEHDGKYYAILSSNQSSEIDNYGETDIVLIEFDQDHQVYINHFGGSGYEPYSEGGELDVLSYGNNKFIVSTSSNSYDYDLPDTLSGGDAWIFGLDFITAIRDNEIRRDLNLYPNPVKTYLNPGLSRFDDFPVEVSIFNNEGKLILKQSVDNPKENIPVGELPAGLYHISTNNSHIKTGSFIKN